MPAHANRDVPIPTTRRLPCRDMGFNPFREHERSVLDIVLVAAAVAVTVGLVGWALFGG